MQEIFHRNEIKKKLTEVSSVTVQYYTSRIVQVNSQPRLSLALKRVRQRAKICMLQWISRQVNTCNISVYPLFGHESDNFQTSRKLLVVLKINYSVPNIRTLDPPHDSLYLQKWWLFFHHSSSTQDLPCHVSNSSVLNPWPAIGNKK
jgi:hypothetical protein